MWRLIDFPGQWSNTGVVRFSLRYLAICMFAIEINFGDGTSDPEMVFVRRHLVVIGASSDAHVELQDMEPLTYQLRLVREAGRKFRCIPTARNPGVQVPKILEGMYENQARIDLGVVKLNVVALDSDLLLKESEVPDRAGVRVLRHACASSSPLYPAIITLGTTPTVLSFVPDSPVYIGTSKVCGLRIDSPDISPKHARMGYESGEFWIEDLGSTHGTFVNGNQVAGRVNVAAGAPINLGRGVVIVGVTSDEQAERAAIVSPDRMKRPAVEERRYPILISVSEVARPARLVIPLDTVINVGRDPSSDIWLGAPHVSRKHCSFSVSKTGQVSITDHSTNGTAYDDGVLKRGDVIQFHDHGTVFDFGGSVTLALCFTEQQEKQFTSANGDPNVFRSSHMSERKDTSTPALSKQLRKSLAGQVSKLSSEASSWRDTMPRLVQIYRSLSFRSKLTLYITVVAVVIVLVVIVNLLARMSF